MSRRFTVPQSNRRSKHNHCRSNPSRRPSSSRVPRVEALEERTLLDASAVTNAWNGGGSLGEPRDANLFALFDQQSQNVPRLRFDDGVLRFGSFQVPASPSQSADPVAQSLEFLDQNRELFGLADPRSELVLKRLVSDPGGGQHVFFEQTVRTIPVYGSSLAVHLEGKMVASTSGNYLLDPPAFLPDATRDGNGAPLPAVICDEFGRLVPAELRNSSGDLLPAVLRSEDAIQVAMANTDGATRAVGEPQLVIYDARLFGDKSPGARLAWRVAVLGSAGTEVVFVSASTGNVLDRFSPVQEHRRPGEDFDIETVHGAGESDWCWFFTDVDDQWFNEDGIVDGEHPDDEGFDAFRFLHQTYQYYYDTFGRASYDGDEEDVEMYLDVTFSDGPNARWNPGCDILEFWDGWATSDVVAHEFTHAVTEYAAGLVYRNQSGALNESYSDVFGAMVQGDWLIGEDLPDGPGFGGGPLRSMSDPPALGQPDQFAAYVPIATDNGGVHLYSGIPNKAAFLVADGGSFSGFEIAGIGREKMQRLYYDTLTHRLSPGSQFIDARDETVEQAEAYVRGARYGFTPSDLCSVINAFASVGLGPSDRDCDGVLDDADRDDDADGTPDLFDNCPTVTNFVQTDTDSDGIGDACDPDDDGDGILDDGDGSGTAGDHPCTGGVRVDCDDNAPRVPNADQYDRNANGIGEVIEDEDGDGIVNLRDNCVGVPNHDQTNSDGLPDGGDACDRDDDNDGILDDGDGDGIEGDHPCTAEVTTGCDDNSRTVANPLQEDKDHDSIGDASDNCVFIANTEQTDSDGDGRGNACDDDDDDDHVADHRDSCPTDYDPFQFDFDHNGIGLVCDESEASLLSGDVAATIRGDIRFIVPGEPVRIPINPCRADGCPDTLPEGYGTFVGLVLPTEMAARIVDDQGFVLSKSKFGANKLLHFSVDADFHYRAPIPFDRAVSADSIHDPALGNLPSASSDTSFTNDYSRPAPEITGGISLSQRPTFRGRRYFLEIFPPTGTSSSDVPITIQVVSGVGVSPPDLVPPTLDRVPDDLTIESPDGSDVSISYQMPVGHDNLDPKPVVDCVPPSGSVVPLGTSVVRCTVSDAAGNSNSAQFGVIIHDSTGPTVRHLSLSSNQNAAAGITLLFSEPLDPARAGDVKNYALVSPGRDGTPGTRDDRAVTLLPPVYDVLSRSVTIRTAAPLGTNQFYSLLVNGSAITDLSGNRLDGNADHTPGDDYDATVGFGTRLSYLDASGDQVTLLLTGGGVMELTRQANGEGSDLRLIDTVATRSTLAGSVRKPKKTLTADGHTTLQSIEGLAGVRNRLPTSEFQIGRIAATVMDTVLDEYVSWRLSPDARVARRFARFQS